MKYLYCPICGNKLEIRESFDEGGVPYCSNDDKMFFDTPKPCIVVAVIDNDNVLLLKQSYIYKNSKVLVSGYVGIDETAEETVYREVLEETGIIVDNIKYLGSDYVQDKELLMITFMARYKSGCIQKSNEVEAASWVALKDAVFQMSEDKIGKKVIKKVLKKLAYEI